MRSSCASYCICPPLAYHWSPLATQIKVTVRLFLFIFENYGTLFMFNDGRTWHNWLWYLKYFTGTLSFFWHLIILPSGFGQKLLRWPREPWSGVHNILFEKRIIWHSDIEMAWSIRLSTKQYVQNVGLLPYISQRPFFWSRDDLVNAKELRSHTEGHEDLIGPRQGFNS